MASPTARAAQSGGKGISSRQRAAEIRNAGHSLGLGLGSLRVVSAAFAVGSLPLVALLGAFAHGETLVSGAAELRAKESDRIETVTAALHAIGVRIQSKPDGFTVRGTPARPRGGVIRSEGDHRVAMLGAVAGAISREGVQIEGSECVGISFPGFFDLLDSVKG